MKTETFTVIYRQGGPSRFRWRRTLLSGDYGSMQKHKEEVERMGYKCLVVKSAHDGLPRPVHGLPETFEQGQSVRDVLALPGGWSQMQPTA